MRPITKELGYETTRADKISKPGLITTQIITHILDDDLVIADLTEKNPNVFYELAIRHATRKSVVQMIFHTEVIPFDVSNARTIKFNHKDLDSADSCRQELKKQIQEVEKDSSLVDSPISTAIEMKALSTSSDPSAKQYAEILFSLSDIRNEITNIRSYYSVAPMVLNSGAIPINAAYVNTSGQVIYPNASFRILDPSSHGVVSFADNTKESEAKKNKKEQRLK